MKLIDMKMTDAEKADMMSCQPCTPPEYPYGLKLCLSEDQIAKLGISGVPAVGSTMSIQANVRVVSAGAREDQDADEPDGQERNLELQIIEMGVDSKKAPDQVAKEMYGA